MNNSKDHLHVLIQEAGFEHPPSDFSQKVLSRLTGETNKAIQASPPLISRNGKWLIIMSLASIYLVVLTFGGPNATAESKGGFDSMGVLLQSVQSMLSTGPTIPMTEISLPFFTSDPIIIWALLAFTTMVFIAGLINGYYFRKETFVPTK